MAVSRVLSAAFQKHCAAPVVKEIWDEMNSLITGVLRQCDDLCLCSDSRNDSPGHSARYCVYTLMEHASKAVVDMAVVNKRETGGNSVVMEKGGLRRLLEKMASVLPFSERATDASSSMMKLVHDMKGMLMLFSYLHLHYLICQVLRWLTTVFKCLWSNSPLFFNYLCLASWFLGLMLCIQTLSQRQILFVSQCVSGSL